MEELIEQILEAAHSTLYLLGGLALPDICGALEVSDGKATGERYIAWFDRWVAPKYVVGPARQPSFSGEDCYYFRCSLLHQGTTQHPRSRLTQIAFLEPGHGIVMHNNVMSTPDRTYLNLDVTQFCSDVASGARNWLQQVSGQQPFEENLRHVVRRHPDGLAPFIIGVPVTARN